MKLMEIIKEKSQQIHFTNVDFMGRFEPQMRGLTETFNQAVHGSFAKGLFNRLLATDEEILQESSLLDTSLPSVQLQQKLQVKVGQEIYCGDWQPLSQQVINEFSQLTGDKQWIHVDVERAQRESPFRTTIAQGYLVLSLLPSLRNFDQYTKSEFSDARLVMNCGLNAVRFLMPVKANSQLRAKARLVSARAEKNYVEVVEEVSIESGRAGRLACVAETVMRV